MFRRFEKRRHQLERLDTGNYTDAEYALWQREMWYIHRLLGDARALRLALPQGSMKDGPLSVLDVGAGSGDLLETARAALGARAGMLVGAELSLAAARTIAARRDDLGALAVQCNALKLPFDDNSFDLVVSSLTLHHLNDADALTLIREMFRTARLKMIIIDLHRHPAAYYLYRTFGRFFFQRFTVEDGSLSILRSFRPDEARVLGDDAGIRHFEVTRRAAFRLVLTANKVMKP